VFYSLAMKASLWDLSLASFRDRTASAEPTPGGGAVCAVSGGLGVGLVLMALEITRRRSAATLVPPLDEAIASARGVLLALSSAADEDVRVFDAYMTAHQLPKQTEPEQLARAEALRDASHDASRAPLDAARHALQALSLTERAAEMASAHVLSDVVAGAELVHAAIVGLLATLSMNLRPDDDSPEVLGFRSQRDQLAADAAEAIEAVRASVRTRGQEA
jgi:methenyltetrahydrofolate cyclohydrolase